jgi:hypothetical protein
MTLPWIWVKFGLPKSYRIYLGKGRVYLDGST